jgi:hypothetical protein
MRKPKQGSSLNQLQPCHQEFSDIISRIVPSHAFKPSANSRFLIQAFNWYFQFVFVFLASFIASTYDMALQMGFGLFDLGEDILHLVITQLSAQSPISMCAFARVSKYCNELVNPVIWRSVRLGKGPRTHLTIEGFLAKRDSSKYVRDIVVQGFGQDKGSPSATELKRMILGVKQLNSFR